MPAGLRSEIDASPRQIRSPERMGNLLIASKRDNRGRGLALVGDARGNAGSTKNATLFTAVPHGSASGGKGYPLTPAAVAR